MDLVADKTTTYTLLLIALNNGEVAGIRRRLHDEPRDGFLILTVDAAGLDELGLELVDRGGVRVGAEVDGDCVDHFGTVCSNVSVRFVFLFLVSGY